MLCPTNSFEYAVHYRNPEIVNPITSSTDDKRAETVNMKKLPVIPQRFKIRRLPGSFQL